MKEFVVCETLSQNDAAAFLGVSVRTLYRLRDEGLPFVKIRGSVRYRLADLRAYQTNHTMTIVEPLPIVSLYVAKRPKLAVER